MWFLDP
ncbi:hypothetical protein CP02DC15_0014B, partial [Chlamydia psittaci 02DC15]